MAMHPWQGSCVSPGENCEDFEFVVEHDLLAALSKGHKRFAALAQTAVQTLEDLVWSCQFQTPFDKSAEYSG